MKQEMIPWALGACVLIAGSIEKWPAWLLYTALALLLGGGLIWCVNYLFFELPREAKRKKK